MRKLYLAVASCVAQVAFMGFSASAFAAEQHDPYCDQYGNEVGVYDFNLNSPDSNMAYEVSTILGSAYACGSSIDNGGVGAETLYNHADVTVPFGVSIADSDLVPVGSRAGWAHVNILLHGAGSGQWAFKFANVESEVSVDDKAECERERAEETTGSTPQGPIVSCLLGENFAGKNWNWSTLTDGELALTIGPMHGTGDFEGVEPGLTFVNLELCDYYGAVDSGFCGNEDDQYQQSNGCGLSTYSVTATREDGTSTASAETNLRWFGHNSSEFVTKGGIGVSSQYPRVDACFQVDNSQPIRP